MPDEPEEKPRVCKECGKPLPLLPNSPKWKEFCSNRCKLRNWRRRKAQEQHPQK